MFVIKFAERMAYVDDFNEGQLEESQYSEFNMEFYGKTLAETQEKVTEFFDVNGVSSTVEWDACDEIGRVDISRLEDNDGNIVYSGSHVYNDFKKGKHTLWDATYTGTAYKMTVVPTDYKNTEEAK